MILILDKKQKFWLEKIFSFQTIQHTWQTLFARVLVGSINMDGEQKERQTQIIWDCKMLSGEVWQWVSGNTKTREFHWIESNIHWSTIDCNYKTFCCTPRHFPNAFQNWAITNSYSLAKLAKLIKSFKNLVCFFTFFHLHKLSIQKWPWFKISLNLKGTILKFMLAV